MRKTILLTGATDGIGLETAKMLVEQGHQVLLHGRNQSKLEKVFNTLSALPEATELEHYLADLSDLNAVKGLAEAVSENHTHLNVIINNAGVFKLSNPISVDGFDLRFVVNTIAPYLLTKLLRPMMTGSSRVVNLSSAAQAPVNMAALAGQAQVADDFSAYAQSKLALTMWSRGMALAEPNGPIMISVNPGSLLKTKMVAEAFGRYNNDISVGAKILVQAALSNEFANATGNYFDNDAGQFADPHPEGLNGPKINEVLSTLDGLINDLV